MKKNILLLFSAFGLSLSVVAQNYWQQEVNYNISVRLNDANHTLKGVVRMAYTNHSPDALPFIWIHLWPNAYRNRQTALHRQLASDTTVREIPSGDAATGFIDSLAFAVNGQPVVAQPHPEHIDIVKILLPAPLAPGASINISTPFYVQLPEYFSRMGHAGNYYMVTQWYPKPAVYDRKGWHPIPYLDRGEFYSEFGSFDVSITLPSAYVVAATGNLQTTDELAAYKTAGSANRSLIGDALRNGKDSAAVRALSLQKIPVTGTEKTLRFTENNIHDFAFFASKDFLVQYDTVKNTDGSAIDVFTFHHPESAHRWGESTGFVKDAVAHYSNWLGAYPYRTVKAVEGPKNQSSGGMEYPTVTLITSPDATPEKLDAVITHEVGHNWFYGILASNERDHPWMDEGINTYYQFRYEAEKYKGNIIFGDAIPAEIRKLPLADFQSTVYRVMKGIPMPEAINTHPTDFASKDQYGLIIYLKTAVWMYMLEEKAGREAVDKAMHTYFEAWKFRHPYPEDLKAILQAGMPAVDMNGFFKLLGKKGAFPE